jgi:hypothetical protein
LSEVLLLGRRWVWLDFSTAMNRVMISTPHDRLICGRIYET